MPLKQEQRALHDAVPMILVYALLYRLPKAVTEVRMYARGGSYPVCPTCRRSLDREYMAFCDRCGQRLSWEEYEDAVNISPC